MEKLGDQTPPVLDNVWLEQFWDRVTTANELLLCLDFDGTLAPIVEDPDEASMAEGNRRLLEQLADAPDITLAIVSGRALVDLRERVDVDDIHYAGNHGLEWDDGSGRTIAADARETQETLQDVLDSLRSKLSDIDGCTIENKSLTATVHYRQVSDEKVPEVIEATEAVVRPTDVLECSSGKEILEVRPDIPGGKDRVVDQLRKQYPDALPVFVGDDVTDEDGFRAVGDDGYGILVGDREETAASVRIPDPGGVTMVLAWLVNRFTDSPDSRPPV